MPDYKEMYLQLFSATEKAINILVAAQNRAEELYISSPEAEIEVLCPPANIKAIERR